MSVIALMKRPTCRSNTRTLVSNARLSSSKNVDLKFILPPLPIRDCDFLSEANRSVGVFHTGKDGQFRFAATSSIQKSVAKSSVSIATTTRNNRSLRVCTDETQKHGDEMFETKSIRLITTEIRELTRKGRWQEALELFQRTLR